MHLGSILCSEPSAVQLLNQGPVKFQSFALLLGKSPKVCSLHNRLSFKNTFIVSHETNTCGQTHRDIASTHNLLNQEQLREMLI